MGRLAPFVKKNTPGTPKEGCFWKVWLPRSSSKKRAPGDSRFSPINSILQEMVCKMLLAWEK